MELNELCYTVQTFPSNCSAVISKGTLMQRCKVSNAESIAVSASYTCSATAFELQLHVHTGYLCFQLLSVKTALKRDYRRKISSLGRGKEPASAHKFLSAARVDTHFWLCPGLSTDTRWSVCRLSVHLYFDHFDHTLFGALSLAMCLPCAQSWLKSLWLVLKHQNQVAVAQNCNCYGLMENIWGNPKPALRFVLFKPSALPCVCAPGGTMPHERK